MCLRDAEEWIESLKKEWSSLQTKKVFEIVNKAKDRKILTVHWLFKNKLGPDREIVKRKTCLVARGYLQVEGIDFFLTYAPVAKHATYRVMFTIARLMGWIVHQVDMVTAFLNSDLDEEVFVYSPPGYPLTKGKVLKVLKALYRLKQSPQVWYNTLIKKLKSLGWRVSVYDPCLLIHKTKTLFIVLWVDDMLIFGSSVTEITVFKAELAEAFEMIDKGECAWYLGMQVDLGATQTIIK